MDCHLGVEFKTAEELGGDEEVLASTATVFAGSGAGEEAGAPGGAKLALTAP